MCQQLALTRPTPSADVSQPDVDSPEHQSGASNLQAIGDKDYPGQAHGILSGEMKRT